MFQNLDTQDVSATVQEYQIAVPANSKLVKILGVWWADNWVAPATVEAIRSGVALRGAVTVNSQTSSPQAGTPKTYFQKLPTDVTLQLYPIPDTTVSLGLLVRAAFRPTRAATTMDDEIFNEWVEVVAAGAIQRLLEMPTQPFHNEAAASIYGRTFAEGCRAASIKARSGATATASSVRFYPFA